MAVTQLTMSVRPVSADWSAKSSTSSTDSRRVSFWFTTSAKRSGPRPLPELELRRDDCDCASGSGKPGGLENCGFVYGFDKAGLACADSRVLFGTSWCRATYATMRSSMPSANGSRKACDRTAEAVHSLCDRATDFSIAAGSLRAAGCGVT